MQYMVIDGPHQGTLRELGSDLSMDHEYSWIPYTTKYKLARLDLGYSTTLVLTRNPDQSNELLVEHLIQCLYEFLGIMHGINAK